MSDRVVTEYSIIESSNPDSLVKVMYAAIAEDWQPIGGIAVVSSATSGTRYLQSIVKYELVDKGHTKQDTTAPEEKMRPECRVCQMRDTCPLA